MPAKTRSRAKKGDAETPAVPDTGTDTEADPLPPDHDPVESQPLDDPENAGPSSGEAPAEALPAGTDDQTEAPSDREAADGAVDAAPEETAEAATPAPEAADTAEVEPETAEDIEFTDAADASGADESNGKEPSDEAAPDRPEPAPGDESEYVHFTDTAEEDPADEEESIEEGNQPMPETPEDEASEQPETPEEPTSESLSFHIHRNLATGRATLAVSSSATDPFYRTIDRLESLEDALPMMACLHQEARAHWEDTPRYPSTAATAQATPAPPAAQRPAPRPAAAKPAQPQAQTQQASLF